MPLTSSMPAPFPLAKRLSMNQVKNIHTQYDLVYLLRIPSILSSLVQNASFNMRFNLSVRCKVCKSQTLWYF